MIRKVLGTAVFIGVLTLSGCGNPSKAAIVQKTSSIKTKAELEKVMGRPDDLNKMGPIETWKYKASDGEVVFVVIGDKVKFEAAGGEKEK